jgi:stearoyl-CoA desaturase (delta-9 desaturase)
MAEKPGSTLKETGFTSWKDGKEINWFHTGLLTITPALAIYGLATTKPAVPTVIFAIFMYFWTGMGITAGYHRLWSHRAYRAHWIVRMMLCLGGAAAFEGSIKWWCRNHRAHHRYTDTDKDPYNARRGFWYSHLGWMLVKQNAKQIGRADITDLQRDPMVDWQHRHYAALALGVGIAFPTLLCWLWGDVWGGFFFACMMRCVFVHHATFFVNSLAHSFGEKTFSAYHTSFDSLLTAVLTLGEGYHNYHHEFPQDYRNGIRAFHYDPTKWLIATLAWMGLAYDLKTVPEQEIRKAQLQMHQHRLDEHRAALHRREGLPAMTWTELQRGVSEGQQLIVIEGDVYDVAGFVHEHPGGRQTLLAFVGKDCTRLFQGLEGSDKVAHEHTRHARGFLDRLRVATLAA